MSTKIRCVKPEFYRHLGLYQLEQRTRLPIRISFEGLWAVADREGRFRWRAHEIKLDVLPYDEVDFAVILEELTRAKFIVHYVVDGEGYGYIPTWKKHQRLNNREKPSLIPAPPECGVNCPLQLELNARGEISPLCESGPLQMQSRSGSGSGSGGGSGSGSGNGSGGGSGKPAIEEIRPPEDDQNRPLNNRSPIKAQPPAIDATETEDLAQKDLSEQQLALRMMDRLSFSGSRTDLQIWADAIKFKARDDGVSRTAAYFDILTKAVAAKKAGEFTKPTFWMKDGCYDHGPKRSKGDVFTQSGNAAKILERQHLAARAESA
jgi:hypothetical protein